MITCLELGDSGVGLSHPIAEPRAQIARKAGVEQVTEVLGCAESRQADPDDQHRCCGGSYQTSHGVIACFLGLRDSGNGEGFREERAESLGSAAAASTGLAWVLAFSFSLSQERRSLRPRGRATAATGRSPVSRITPRRFRIGIFHVCGPDSVIDSWLVTAAGIGALARIFPWG